MLKSEFCIAIDFEKGSENPSRVFRAMFELIEAFQRLDVDLVKSIDSKIEPIALLEDIETGSIKAWLGHILRNIDDQALKELDWKPLIGQYLVKSKYAIINFLENKTEITDRQQIEALEKDLLRLAEETEVRTFPAYSPIARPKLLSGISDITKALSHLSEEDKATFQTPEGTTGFNLQFNFAPDSIEKLLTDETITNTSEMILKVKKPDYLGESRWEFRHGATPISAKVADNEWLHKFQNRQVDIRPGDSIRAKVEITVKYGYDKEVVSSSHIIVEVVEILPFVPPDTSQIPIEPNDE